MVDNVNCCDYYDPLNLSHKLNFSGTNNLSILHVNIRSPQKHIDDLQELLSTLNFLPDIIAITETRIKYEPVLNINISGYKFFFVKSFNNAGCIGVYIHNSLNCTVSDKFHIALPSCENMWLNLKAKDSKCCVVGILYRHPFSTDVVNFIELLNETLQRITSVGHKCVIPEFGQNYEMLNERNSNPSDMKQLPQNQPDDELPNFNNSYISTQNFKNHYLNSNDFLMIHINMRSLNKNFEKLEKLLPQLGKLPDIIAISEIKLHSRFCFYLEGYLFIQQNSNTKAGGVGMFIKDTINYKTVSSFNLKVEGCEELWVKINSNKTEKLLAVLYRHPGSNICEYHSSFETSLESLNQHKLQYCNCGGINIDLLQCELKASVKNYKEMLVSLGCLPLIKYPTRISSSSATLIDDIYTNNVTHATATYILYEDISDHLPVMLLLKNKTHKITSNNTLNTDTKYFISDEFLMDLYDNFENWQTVNQSVDDQFDNFIKIFDDTLSKHAPLRKKSTKEQKISVKPWITKGILTSSKMKNKLYTASLKGSIEKIQQYKIYRNKFTHLKEKAKANYYNSLITQKKDNMKSLRKTINDIAKYKKRTICQIKELTIEARKRKYKIR